MTDVIEAEGLTKRIAGYDVVDQAVEVRQLIALTGQFA
jgi:hypothetical protein